VSSVFENKLKTVLKSFRKFEIQILDVDSFEIYNPAKSQLKIPCILGYEKIWQNFKIWKYALFITLRSAHLFFFSWASNTTNLDFNFCTLVDLIIIYLQIFHSEFLKTFKFHFQFFQKTTSVELRSHMSILGNYVTYIAHANYWVDTLFIKSYTYKVFLSVVLFGERKIGILRRGFRYLFPSLDSWNCN
jgi:hypothetical protein